MPNDLTPAEFASLRYCDLKTGERVDWLYFPEAKRQGLQPDTILLAAPGTSSDLFGRQQRLVWKASTKVERIPEAEFQRLIREQNPPAAK